MIQRTALLAASLVASLVLFVGLVLAGVGPAAPDGPAAAQPVAATTVTPPEPTIQVDTVYLAPKAQPEVITVTRAAKATTHGDDEGEGEND